MPGLHLWTSVIGLLLNITSVSFECRNFWAPRRYEFSDFLYCVFSVFKNEEASACGSVDRIVESPRKEIFGIRAPMYRVFNDVRQYAGFLSQKLEKLVSCTIHSTAFGSVHYISDSTVSNADKLRDKMHWRQRINSSSSNSNKLF